jgi:hypothetical protein
VNYYDGLHLNACVQSVLASDAASHIAEILFFVFSRFFGRWGRKDLPDFSTHHCGCLDPV